MSKLWRELEKFGGDMPHKKTNNKKKKEDKNQFEKKNKSLRSYQAEDWVTWGSETTCRYSTQCGLWNAYAHFGNIHTRPHHKPGHPCIIRTCGKENNLPEMIFPDDTPLGDIFKLVKSTNIDTEALGANQANMETKQTDDESEEEEVEVTQPNPRLSFPPRHKI